MQRIIVALIVTVVLGLAYASGALAADMTIPPPDFSQMGKAPPDFSEMGKAPSDFLEMGKGKAPPPIIGKGPMATKGPLFTKAPLLPPPPTWTGFYVGGDAGAAWLSTPATWNPLPDPATFGVFPNSATIAASVSSAAVTSAITIRSCPTGSLDSKAIGPGPKRREPRPSRGCQNPALESPLVRKQP